MTQIDGLDIPSSFLSGRGLFFAFLAFAICFVIGWAMIHGYLGSGKGSGTSYRGVGAGFIVFLMFTMLPLVLGTASAGLLGGPYDSFMQRAGTCLVFLATQAAWNLWLYLGGGFDFFYYD
jgi:hypothetical protein